VLYAEILKALGRIVGPDTPGDQLLRDLDDAVGARLADVEAQGAARWVRDLVNGDRDVPSALSLLASVGVTVTVDTPSTPTASSCPCQWANIANHDHLLTLDLLAFPQLVEELEGFESQIGEDTPDEVPWFEFEQFVHEHNWTYPIAMCRLASMVEGFCRPTSDRWQQTVGARP
jgi:hypothetical protein